jgi:hypothetical protein
MVATYSQECRKNALDAMCGVAGAGLTVRLVSNAVLITDTTRWVDCVEATFDGYTPYHSSQWSPPAIDVDASAFILSPVIVFTRIAGTSFNTIYAYAVTLDDGTDIGPMLMVESLPQPIPMVVATDQVPLRVKVSDRQGT